MQNQILKFPLKVLLILCFIIQPSWSQNVKTSLKAADSLFSLKKYTQAYKIYEHLFSHEKSYSDEMLLKMAFIQEGLGNYTKTLYYLNTLYNHTTDSKVRQKIESLAEKHKLNGYEYSDFKFAYGLYTHYNFQIIGLISVLLLLLTSILVVKKIRGHHNYKLPAFLIIGLSLIIFVGNTSIAQYEEAILTDTTNLMSGPSAGADVVDVLSEGNKVEILGESDVWLKVLLNDKEGFIRKNHSIKLG